MIDHNYKIYQNEELCIQALLKWTIKQGFTFWLCNSDDANMYTSRNHLNLKCTLQVDIVVTYKPRHVYWSVNLTFTRLATEPVLSTLIFQMLYVPGWEVIAKGKTVYVIIAIRGFLILYQIWQVPKPLVINFNRCNIVLQLIKMFQWKSKW